MTDSVIHSHPNTFHISSHPLCFHHQLCLTCKNESNNKDRLEGERKKNVEVKVNIELAQKESEIIHNKHDLD